MSEPQDSAGYERCGGKKKAGGTCGLPAGHGTDHVGVGRCRRHAGSTPSHEAQARRVLAERACAKFGIPVKTTPAQALHDELARSNGIVAYLMARVSELAESGELVWGTEKRIIKPVQGGGQPQVEIVQGARVHPLATMLERERRHLANVAVEMQRLGIEARMLRVTETQVHQLGEALRAILADLHLTPEQQARVPEVVPHRLRALSAVPDPAAGDTRH